jgi:hypothetical protein
VSAPRPTCHRKGDVHQDHKLTLSANVCSAVMGMDGGEGINGDEGDKLGNPMSIPSSGRCDASCEAPGQHDNDRVGRRRADRRWRRQNVLGRAAHLGEYSA